MLDRPGKRRDWMVPAIAVGVGVLVALVAVLAAITFHSGSSASSHLRYETFSEAESNAQAGASSAAGGPWFAVIGAAIVTPTPVVEPATNVSSLLGVANCTLLWPSGGPTSVTIPSTGPPAGMGTAAYWTIVLKNGSNDLLVESVSDGNVSTVLSASGTNCTTLGADLIPFAAGIIDSPNAISQAGGVGGTAFLAAHPNATEFWVAIGGVSLVFVSTGPEWYVEYTSCTLPTSASQQGAVFNATIEGTTGIVTAHHSGTASCALTAPTGASLIAHAGTSAPAARKAI